MSLPAERPERSWFSSGPCAKPPGWSLAVLCDATVGRSHRAAVAKAKLQEVIERSRDLLRIPADYRLAIWNLLGGRGVDVLAWESFGKTRASDVSDELGLADLRILEADYGDLPDLTRVDRDRDLVFT